MLLGDNTRGGALELPADRSLMFAELCSGGYRRSYPASQDRYVMTDKLRDLQKECFGLSYIHS
jgi:hypothetical protein